MQFRSPEEIKEYQEARLRETLAYVAANSPYYRRTFAEAGVDISSVKRLEDLAGLPVTTKEDLQRHGDEFLCVPRREVIDYVTTSGTLGTPVTFMLTSADLDRLARNEALSFSTAGCTPDDVIQLMTTIDRRFMAGLAYFMGARQLGCGVARVGNGIPELQWDTISRINPTVCMVVPSFLIKLMDYAEAQGIDFRKSSLRKAICIGEALRKEDFTPNALGQQLARRWPELELYSTYASTEMQTSFTECGCSRGGHLQPGLIILEVLDDDSRPVAEGEAGEVTVTTLGVEGMPLVRFRTGDRCTYSAAPCACGRNTVRVSPVIGRKGQMIKYKGTTLYPPAIYDVLDNIPEISNYIVEVYSNELGTDEITVRIGSADHSDEFSKRVKDIFRAKIRVAPQLIFESPETISEYQMPPMSRKPIKFVYLGKK